MAMDDVRDRIEKELGSVMGRLRQLGGAVVIEEFPGALGDNSPFSDPTEEVQVQGEREVSFATRSLLVERANRPAEALGRGRDKRGLWAGRLEPPRCWGGSTPGSGAVSSMRGAVYRVVPGFWLRLFFR